MAWFGLQKKLSQSVSQSYDKENTQHHLPFSVVIEQGDLEGVKIALENEVDRGKDARDVVNARSGVMVNTPLHVACEHGFLPIVNFLLSEGASPAQEDRSGTRPVHLAAANGHTKVIEALVQAGVDVTVPEGTGQSAMHWAAACGELEVVNLLILHHAPVETVDKEGWTPLHCAARNGRALVVERLLMRNADITRLTKTGDSALHLAVQAGNAATVQVLLQWKADLHERGADGARPYEMAGSNDPIMKALFREALISMPAPEELDESGGAGGAGDDAPHPKSSSVGGAGSVKGGRTGRESLLQRTGSRNVPRDSWFKPRPEAAAATGLTEGLTEEGSLTATATATPGDDDPQSHIWDEVDRDFYRWEDLVIRIKMELAASRRRGPLVVVPAVPTVGSGAAAVAALQQSQQQQMVDEALRRQRNGARTSVFTGKVAVYRGPAGVSGTGANTGGPVGQSGRQSIRQGGGMPHSGGPEARARGGVPVTGRQ